MPPARQAVSLSGRNEWIGGVMVLTLTLASLQHNLAFLEVLSLPPEPVLTSSEPLRRWFSGGPGNSAPSPSSCLWRRKSVIPVSIAC